MNSSQTIVRMANDIYENNAEMIAIYNSQSLEIDRYEIIIQRVFLNNLVKYCNVEGIRRFEAIFNIQANELEDNLDLRKKRIINKLSALSPFTKIFVQLMLSELFGEDKIEFEIQYNNYKVKIGIESSLDNIVDETFKELRQIIPANIIIEKIVYFPYLHGYLKRNYTHSELAQFKQEELSQYA